jgi:hypothetical protein
MKMPGFTAENGLAPSELRYAGKAVATAGVGGHVQPALVAPPSCATSACVTVGRCRTRVRCCRDFTGRCVCRTTPCFIF